jgi:hypothetical protein
MTTDTLTATAGPRAQWMLDSLDDALVAEALAGAAPIEEQPEHPWRCDSLEKAIWIARILQRRQREILEIEQVVQAEIIRLEAWRDSATAPMRNDSERLASHLEYYTRTQHLAGGGKTVKLPGGVRCALRKATPQIDHNDDEVLEWTSWLPEQLRAALTKMSLRWGELKKRLVFNDDGTAVYPETGEVVPGITVTPPASDLAFSVSADTAPDSTEDRQYE